MIKDGKFYKKKEGMKRMSKKILEQDVMDSLVVQSIRNMQEVM